MIFPFPPNPSKWESYFMDVAFRTSELSYCKRLKVGAVATKAHRIIAVGFNGTLPGDGNCCEDETGRTLETVYHAEENLILFALRESISLINATLYITHSPCLRCAKLIRGSGIRTTYYYNEYRSREGIDFLSIPLKQGV